MPVLQQTVSLAAQPWAFSSLLSLPSQVQSVIKAFRRQGIGSADVINTARFFRSMRWQRTSYSSIKALRPEASQGPDEVDGNPVHLLRHTHCKRGAADRQDSAETQLAAS